MIIYDFDDEKNIVTSLQQVIEFFFNLWKNIDFVIMNEKNWMRIFFKSDWEIKMSEKAKIYSLRQKDRILIDETFDKLHEFDKLFWITEFISFSYLLFCVWKIDVNDKRKKRVVIDIRDLNVIIQSNAYSLSLQSNIIQLMTKCDYIIVINATFFFYQWKVHFNDRHKLTIVFHRDQKSFNVVILKYKNSSTYVQRQIDRILRFHREYARAYVDDVMIFSKTLKEHVKHFYQTFNTLNFNNITLQFVKTFVDYSTIQLLSQKVNSFDLTTVEDKFRAIALLKFLKGFR